MNLIDLLDLAKLSANAAGDFLRNGEKRVHPHPVGD